MTVTVYDFPTEWYDLLVRQKFNLRSINQAAPTTWNGTSAAISGPHTQLWISEMTFAPLADHMRPDLGPVLQDIGAFFARLRGRSGVLRMSHMKRLRPWFDRSLIAATSRFTDGSSFTDGSGFASGYLPPEVFLASAATAGARYIVLGGFPVSTSNVLRRGDLLQIKPNGIPGTVPHLYVPMFGGGSNSAGQVGVAIEPGLRQGVAAGDVVELRNAASLFRLADDSQFDIEDSGAESTCGGSLVEALDLIP